MQNQDIETILGDDIHFRGKLNFKQNLQINGKFRGQIITDGHLIVGPLATVEADIEAGRVSIQGNVRGNISANQNVSLLKQGNLHGDIKTPDLRIESGSQFSGSCNMD